MPADLIREAAHAYANADRAMICWTLGITEHHNAVDNVFCLINLALLTGHVGRYGSGLNPLRGQNNVQGGGDMGAIPNKLPGFQDIELDHEARARYEQAWGVTIPPRYGWHLTQMFEAMERGELKALYVVGENPAQSEADAAHTLHLLEGLDHLVVQDIFLTRTAELADVVLPASASWCESEGTVTNSERRVQRVRRALDPPGQARDDIEIVCELAARLGHDWGHPSAEQVWDELRSLSPMHAGMSYRRLDEGGLQWPCWDEQHPGEQFLHSRLWDDPVTGPPAPFNVVVHELPVDELSDEFPIRLTTGRRLDSYNTGVQSGGYTSPLRRGESLDLSPEDCDRLGLAEGERVRVTSRRGSVVAPVRVDDTLRPGLAFMTLHFPDEVETNVLTIDATDPKSGTAEFKASAIRVEKLPAGSRAGRSPVWGHRPASCFRVDLRLTATSPRPLEREAVDAVLGPPTSAWEGAARGIGRPFLARRPRRAVPAPPAPARAARAPGTGRLDQRARASATSAAGSRSRPPRRTASRASTPCSRWSLARPRVVHVCTDIACMCRGSAELVEELERTVGPAGQTHGGRHSIWLESPCLGMCEQAPAALVTDRRRGVRATTRSARRAWTTSSPRWRARLREPYAPAHVAAAGGDLRLLRRIGQVDPDQHRQLSQRRRLRRAAARARARPGGRDPRGHRVEAAGPRRRRVPDGAQVGCGRAQPGAPALPRLQRRRVGAGHVQGPDRDRERPVRADRGAHDRRLRDRIRARLHLPARRVPAGLAASDQRDRGGAHARPARRRRDGLRAQLRHRAAQGRRRLHLRRGDGALQLDRGLPRRAAQQAAVPGRRRAVRASRPWSTTSRA